MHTIHFLKKIYTGMQKSEILNKVKKANLLYKKTVQRGMGWNKKGAMGIMSLKLKEKTTIFPQKVIREIF